MPLPLAVNEHVTFAYTDSQFVILNKLTVGISSVSLFFSFLVIVFYVLFMYYERSRADRVSLRCVVLGSISNVLDTIMDISSSVGDTEQKTCRALGLIVDFMDVINACCLSIIGINLFLIFVIKVHRSERLERYYYPSIMLYSIITMIVPVIEEVRFTVPIQDESWDCWHFNHIANRDGQYISWMVYYALLYFIVLLGLSCSLVAVFKLIREESANFQIIRHVAPTAHYGLSCNKKTKPRLAQKHYQQTSFSKVILRCLTYTLVPVLVHVWGFTLQILVSLKKDAPFGLMAAHTAFSSAEGIMTSMVFFSEPVVVSYIKEKASEFYRIYGEEFSILEEYGHGTGAIRLKQQNQQRRVSTVSTSLTDELQSVFSTNTTGTQCTSTLFDKRNLVPRSATVENQYHPHQQLSMGQMDLGDRNSPHLAPPNVPLSPISSVGSLYVITCPAVVRTSTSSPTSTTTSSYSYSLDDPYPYEDTNDIRTIPMRRVSVSSSVYSRIRSEYERRLSDETTASTLVNDGGIGRSMVPSTDTPDEIFIPYRSPALARAAHWMFVHIDRLRGHQISNNNDDRINTSQQQQYNEPPHYDGDLSLGQITPEVMVQSPSMRSSSTRSIRGSH
ncbi:hypothetical protein BDA99DRAFT_535889 [Phascolomyces articulosus]|uniref:Uncharacterized protein n=1 Tax=Phascolomyces articulosus TaxID=60185 RepID=A0AAD5KGM0_9FUNG|nr:hypothetical protein BDA99DRAFT_535889 [Phascolomyces articulosus]